MQRWMQEVVVHPGGVADAVASRGARAALRGASIENVVLPSRTLGPAERKELGATAAIFDWGPGRGLHRIEARDGTIHP